MSDDETLPEADIIAPMAPDSKDSMDMLVMSPTLNKKSCDSASRAVF